MAVNFLASGDYIDYGDNTNVNSLTQISIEAWIYATVDDAGNNVQSIVGKYNSPTDTQGWLFLRGAHPSSGDFLRDLYFYAFWSTGIGQWRSPTSSILINTLYHAVMTYDASSTANNPKMYVNGVSKTVTKLNSPTGSWASNSGNSLRVSNNSSGTSFIGKLQRTRIYNAILTQAQITALYNGGKPLLNGYDANCVFSDELLTCSSSGSGGSIFPFTGTLVNGTNIFEDRINGVQGATHGSPTGASDLIFGTGY